METTENAIASLIINVSSSENWTIQIANLEIDSSLSFRAKNLLAIPKHIFWYQLPAPDPETFPSQNKVEFGKDGESLAYNLFKLQSTYETAGWDFSTIWDIDEGVSYPYHL